MGTQIHLILCDVLAHLVYSSKGLCNKPYPSTGIRCRRPASSLLPLCTVLVVKGFVIENSHLSKICAHTSI